jgi:hypothetical protein
MSETTETARDAVTAPLLADNPYVQELFSIMQENGRDSTGLAALLGHVSEMESFVKRAEDKISEMKSQLAEMKEIQNHPVKKALQNAIKTLELKVAEVKERLSELKHNIVEGCKSAVQAFKEKGISALDKLASFFHIKSGVQVLDKSVQQSVSFCDKSVQQIDNFSREYRTASRAVKNIGRLLIGKEPIDAKKEAGILAKSLAAPYKAEKTVLLKISGLAKAMETRLEQLETTAAEKRANRVREPKEPTLLGELAEAKQLVEQKKLEAPMPERSKVKAAEL